jgi:hypothetical protein
MASTKTGVTVTEDVDIAEELVRHPGGDRALCLSGSKQAQQKFVKVSILKETMP